VLTNKQTNKQTRRKHNLLGGGNEHRLQYFNNMYLNVKMTDDCSTVQVLYISKTFLILLQKNTLFPVNINFLT